MGVVAPSGGGSGARIEVDPDVLIRCGHTLSSLGAQLVSLSDALGAAVSSGIASGMDPAGADFGIKYGHQAQDFADALAMAATAYDNVGYMLAATGFNYENADAVSTIGGSGPAGGVGQPPGKTVAGHASVGPNSIVVPPPALWYLVEPFIGIAMEWPSGHPALMRVTGYYATLRGREYHATTNGPNVILRSYAGEPPVDGFGPSRIPGVQGILTVQRSDLEKLAFVRTVCTWRGQPFMIVGLDRQSVYVFYVGSQGEWVIQQPGMVRTGKLEAHGRLELSDVVDIYEFVDPLAL